MTLSWIAKPPASVTGKLTADAWKAIVDILADRKLARWEDASTRSSALVFGRSLPDWGAMLYAWAADNGQTGSVCTIFELTEGEGIQGTGR